jgi:RNA polymerase sigma-70 factor (ECF subfamily)
MTDGELVRQARSGQAAALAELTHRWAGKILALCHVQVGRPDIAPDLAQEVLLRALRSLNKLLEPDKFGPWLRGIAKRVCFDWLKTQPRAAVPFSTLGSRERQLDHVCAQEAESPMERQESAQELHDAVAALPEECREVLLLYYYQDVTYQELAELLNVSFATINARLTRARALLRDRLRAGQESVR